MRNSIGNGVHQQEDGGKSQDGPLAPPRDEKDRCPDRNDVPAAETDASPGKDRQKERN
ncbi:MAG: hypothetical protein WDO73_20330 [Ignavibacteriota bacterium]